MIRSDEPMKKVLVIDDDQDMLENVQTLLSSEGYEVFVMTDWEKVLMRVKEFDPDLIILDVQLFGMDGRIICRYLKDTPDTRHIPIIMFSSYPLTGTAVKDYGADGFISKPFELDKMIGLVKELTGGSRED